jgi:hypothetical protein
MVVASTASALAGLATIMIVLAIGSAICGGSLLVVSILSRLRKRSSLRAVGQSAGSSSEAGHSIPLVIVPTPEYAELEERLSGKHPSDNEEAYEPAREDIPAARADAKEAQEPDNVGFTLQTLRALREELESLENQQPNSPAVRAESTGQELAAEVDLLAQAIRARTRPAGPLDTPSSAAAVPQREQLAAERLPIFDSVESDWFRRSPRTFDWSPPKPKAGTAPVLPAAAATPTESARPSWTALARPGWQAAEEVAQSAAEEVTSAGLPRRVPGASVYPGTADDESATPEPPRSADAARDRMASLQRGVTEAQAAVSSSGGNPPEEDEGSQGTAATGSGTSQGKARGRG